MNKIMLLLSCMLILSYTLCVHSQQIRREPFTLKYVEEYKVNTLDPLRAENDAELRLASLIYNSLVAKKKEQDIAELLENLTTETRGLRRTFTLRGNVQWYACRIGNNNERIVQAIKPFKAADVKYTFEQIKNDRNSRYHSIADRFRDVEIDEYNKKVTFVLRDSRDDKGNYVYENLQPIDIYTYLIFPIIPQPPCANDNYNDTDCATYPEEQGKTVIGTGPYVFLEESEGSITLERNKEYFLGWPDIDNRTKWPIDKICVDPPQRYTDLVTVKNIFIVPADPKINLLINVPLEAYSEIHNAPYATTLLHSYNFTSFPFNCAKWPFRDPNIRKGFTYLLNREQIFQNVYGNVYDPKNIERYLAPCPLPPILRDPELKQQPSDTERANQLFGNAQFTPTRYQPKLKVFIIGGSELDEICTQFINQMNNHGIRIDKPNLNQSEWNQAKRNGDFEITFLQQPFEQGKNIIANSFATGAPDNFVGYSNPKLDRLLNEYGEKVSINEQINVMHEISKLLNEECPYIFLFSLDKIAAYRSDLLSVVIDPDSFFAFINLWYALR